jgi:PrtD family type I secretion system ABC transporter
MQSLILGLGAYLAIERLTTVGAIFAASILLGRALQPVEQIVGSWRSLVAARTAYRHLQTLLLETATSDQATVMLPRPDGRLSVEGLHYALPQTSKMVLANITFRLEAGEALGIIGPSGAGKSTLARQVLGILRPSAGVVRLDEADIVSWPRKSLGGHLGYLPQDVELFADTVAANICRFGPSSDSEVIEAARIAGVHDMILRLPDGYETQVGEGGAVLSGGYRQRIALARAVFGSPSLVVLDEPSSNLDTDGDIALADCIDQLKARRTTVIIISHRSVTLNAVDKILILRDGMIDTFADRATVFARIARSAAETRPIRPVQTATGA